MIQKRILIIGAHPDDCDIRAAGTTALWVDHGFEVKFVSMTSGDAGHHEISGPELAERRAAEAQAAASVLGVSYDVLEHHDGHLQVTLETRKEVVRIIRSFAPDLVLTHRPNDYHPDHRYTSMLVQDAAYMVTVPPFAPETPFLRKNPVFGYLGDEFQRPYPFTPDVAVGIDSVIDRLLKALHCHTSQMYEWLPFNAGIEGDVPEGEADRKRFLRDFYVARLGDVAGRFRDLLIRGYGPQGRQIVFAEAFEISEYGGALTDELRRELFPFVR